MPFEITCQSIKEFDPESQAYVHCGKVLQVDESQIGLFVQCPDCKNPVEVKRIDEKRTDEVSGSNDQSSSFPVASAHSGSPLLDDGMLELGDQHDGPSTANSAADVTDGVFDDILVDEPAQKPLESGPDLSPLLTPSTNQPDPTSELKKESIDSASQSLLQQSNFARKELCRKCGASLEPQQAICKICQTKRQAAYVDKKDREPTNLRGPFGFQRWIAGMTNTDVDSSMMNYFAFTLLGGVVFLGIVIFLFGPFLAKPFGIAATVIASVGILSLIFWVRLLAKPTMHLPLPVQWSWHLVLVLCRRFKFRKYSEKKRLIANDEDFGDLALSQNRNLGLMKVIDLQGTKVTDEGLLHLYDLRGIHFLVLKETEVTPDAVNKLQATIPKTWIWY